MKEFFCSIEPDTFIAFFALIVSISGLIWSVIYNRKTLNHSKEFNKLTLETTVFHSFETIGRIEKFEVKNKGPGPAILKSIKFSHPDLGFEQYSQPVSIYSQLLGNDFKLLTGEKNFSYYNIQEYYPLGANDTLEIYTISYTEKIVDSKIAEIHKKLHFTIEYQNIFKEMKMISGFVFSEFEILPDRVG